MTAKQWMLLTLAVFTAAVAANLATAYIVGQQINKQAGGSPLVRLLTGS